MMKDYFKARQDIVASVRKELLGPGSEDIGISGEEEIITDRPITRYTLGILFPQQMIIENDVDTEGEDSVASGKDIKYDEKIDAHISLTNQYCPSALGISFYAEGVLPSLKVSVNTAKYNKIKDPEDCKLPFISIPLNVLEEKVFKDAINVEDKTLYLKRKVEEEEFNLILGLSEEEGYKKLIRKLKSQLSYGWKRIPVRKEVTISQQEAGLTTYPVDDNLELVCVSRIQEKQKTTLFTISLVNTERAESQKDDSKAYYQSGFTISSPDENDIFLEYRCNSKFQEDPEICSYELLYYSKKQFATGHGCSVKWEEGEESRAKTISTEHIPYYEISDLEFNIPEINNNIPEVLSMRNLSDFSEKKMKAVLSELYEFCEIYNSWVIDLQNKKDNFPEYLDKTIEKHIEGCDEAYHRMIKGVQLLEKNEEVHKAFMLANRAMLMHRLHTGCQATKRFPGDDEFIVPEYSDKTQDPKWRPFQLAFILITLNSISDPSCSERDIIDLIWFPTGGGKTEAYLGVSAFTIFLRRLKDHVNGAGTTILMRYTLRLLTSQQFQRASTLICACEKIRQEMPDDLGRDSITIGLWIGGASTPNTIDDAVYKFKALQTGSSRENPFQLLNCPWCGTKMVKEFSRGRWGYIKRTSPKRFVLFCPETKCDFHGELPVKVTDEDVYNTRPTLLFGTVDKFAMMPWKKEVSNLFSRNTDELAPELIIQDELHLISGPLGTIVGLYETAIDFLCSAKGLKPKIISSTATIRRANEQCKSLYNRVVRQFPTPGLDARDSFFAREKKPTAERPGRLYIGIMSSGKTQTTTEIRLMATLLQAVWDLQCDEAVKDLYWTLVTYFNSLRELGQCVTLVNDDIKDHIKRIALRRSIKRRMFYEPEELTSRRSAYEIPSILEKLETQKYPDPKAIQILLASNMMATGVDVERLGLMLVVGQPKTTSEYIQATSRIGRKYPGLVFTLYDGARPRDRSHFEHFIPYHQAFYKYVEPTSVTPFSGAARERALHAVLVTLVRHLEGLAENKEATEISSLTTLGKLEEMVCSRVKEMDPKEEAATRREIEELFNEWKEAADTYENLTYGTLSDAMNKINIRKEGIPLLKVAGREEAKGKWFTLTSMRDVDVECNVEIRG